METFQCPKCEQIFTSEEDMWNHYGSAHKTKNREKTGWIPVTIEIKGTNYKKKKKYTCISKQERIELDKKYPFPIKTLTREQYNRTKINKSR
jgi:uncharacterized C2H2 Zn-finger protein